MSQSGLENFGAYQKAQELFELFVADMETIKTNPLCYRLVSQQIGSADSFYGTEVLSDFTKHNCHSRSIRDTDTPS